MNVFDRLVLLLTGLIAIYLIWYFVKKQKEPQTACSCNIYYIISFAVLLVAGLLLIFFGWDALATRNLVALSSMPAGKSTSQRRPTSRP